MKSIRVQTEPSYEVLIGEGLLARAGKLIAKTAAPSQVIVVTSRRVARLHGTKLRAGLRGLGKVTWIELPDGEQVKSFRHLETLVEQFAKAGADRAACVVAFGGGSIGDLAGMAASIYMRGISVVQVPTTLLAQVDASVGGKTAVNLSAAKNLAGTFHQPLLVIADTAVLGTLSDRDYRAGLFEVVKCGAIRDASLFRFCEQNAEQLLARDRRALDRVIAAAVRVKAEIVAADERESGLRKLLNFGHTVGHALEAAGGYRKLLHGEAIALGVIAAAEIGVNSGVTPEDVAERLIDCVLQYGPLPRAMFQFASVMRATALDKKASRRNLNFVLLDKIGSASVHRVSSAIVREAVRSVTA